MNNLEMVVSVFGSLAKHLAVKEGSHKNKTINRLLLGLSFPVSWRNKKSGTLFSVRAHRNFRASFKCTMKFGHQLCMKSFLHPPILPIFFFLQVCFIFSLLFDAPKHGRLRDSIVMIVKVRSNAARYITGRW